MKILLNTLALSFSLSVIFFGLHACAVDQKESLPSGGVSIGDRLSTPVVVVSFLFPFSALAQELSEEQIESLWELGSSSDVSKMEIVKNFRNNEKLGSQDSTWICFHGVSEDVARKILVLPDDLASVSLTQNFRCEP